MWILGAKGLGGFTLLMQHNVCNSCPYGNVK
jgi:hypothetical protein